MIPPWIWFAPVSFFGGNNTALPIPNFSNGKSTSLDFKKYLGLVQLEDSGATKEQLQTCQKGFALFKALEKFGFSDYTNELTEGCVEILEIDTAIPQDFSVFFGTAAYLIRHNLLEDCEITDLARWQASLIRNNLNPKQVQDATWKRYVTG